MVPIGSMHAPTSLRIQALRESRDTEMRSKMLSQYFATESVDLGEWPGSCNPFFAHYKGNETNFAKCKMKYLVCDCITFSCHE